MLISSSVVLEHDQGLPKSLSYIQQEYRFVSFHNDFFSLGFEKACICWSNIISNHLRSQSQEQSSTESAHQLSWLLGGFLEELFK
jgi:hypothetical protein